MLVAVVARNGTEAVVQSGALHMVGVWSQAVSCVLVRLTAV
jgi:hypothetical protein